MGENIYQRVHDHGFRNRLDQETVESTPASLSSQIRPPMSSTSRRQMVKPRPVPPCLRVVDISAWLKGWNNFADCSFVMPMPVSRTENLSCTFSPVRSSC